MKNNKNSLEKISYIISLMGLIFLMIFSMFSCEFNNPKNRIDYRNFSDDHSIDYRYLMNERIQKEKVLKKRLRIRKKQMFFEKFETTD